MVELLRTNDAVLISFIEALLSDAGIAHVVLDSHMSIMEGSIGVLPRRVLVEDSRLHAAKRLMEEAGIGHEFGSGV